jgi:hypothetical protein
MGRNRVHIPAVAALAVVLLATPLSAQTETARTLALELNRVDQVGDACRFTFLAENRSGFDMSRASRWRRSSSTPRAWSTA